MHKRYSMSFTTGSLFHRESVRLAELFLEYTNWSTVKEKVHAGNLLQARTLNTAKKICNEIISRLKTLSLIEADLLVHSNDKEQGYILWVAICRRYTFIADFAIEVIRERFINLKNDLNYEDFDSFFNKKTDWHPELDKIKTTTRNKLRQVLFKILRETDLITADYIIKAAMLSHQFLNALPYENRSDVLLFPTFQTDFWGEIE